MTTPKDAKDLFAEAQSDFAPVVGVPNDDDVKRLNKAFVNALHLINVPGGAVNLSDILLSNDDRKAKHGDMTSESPLMQPTPCAPRLNASGPPRLISVGSSRQSNAPGVLSF